MGTTTVNKMPSPGLPLVTDGGRIHPAWYEFFRAFIAQAVENVAGNDNTALTVIEAGNGLTETEDPDNSNLVTFAVGAGSGLTVNANDVNIDIASQFEIDAEADDEILVSDRSDNNNIRKTKIRNITSMSVATPGGSNTEVQYNSSGAFAGDSNFTTDGSGSVSITGDLTVDNININGNVFATDANTTPFIFEVPTGGLNQYYFRQSGTGNSVMTANFVGYGASAGILIRSDSSATSSTSDSLLSFATDAGAAEWTMGLYDNQDDDLVLANSSGLNIGQIFTVDRGTRQFRHQTQTKMEALLLRYTIAGITASTTQSQGQGALTAEVNEVSTVANANDTVTLPTAVAGTEIIIINNGANTLQIFPASGDNLGAGVDTSTTLASGSNVKYVAYNATNWEVI